MANKAFFKSWCLGLRIFGLIGIYTSSFTCCSSLDNSGYIFYPDSSLVLFDSTEMKYSLFYLYMIKPLPLNQCENIQNALQHHQMSPLEDDSPFGSASSSSGNKIFFQTTICVTTSIPVLENEWNILGIGLI